MSVGSLPRTKAVRTLLVLFSAAGGVAAAGLLLFAVDPAGSAIYPPCLFHAATGLHCPGCGSLRALHQLLHGNVQAALGLNPLMVLSLPFVAYGTASCALRRLDRRPLPTLFTRPWLGWALLGLIMAFAVLRNVPAFPFSLLAP
ncbi:MAG: DUF2752 domain-containing protein [Planctomycetota bacterium]|jgi:hypothetical protein